MAERDTYRYHLKKDGKIVHRGITNDFDRRESEHRLKSPGIQLKQVGPKTTRKAALKWEREGGKRPYRS